MHPSALLRRLFFFPSHVVLLLGIASIGLSQTIPRPPETPKKPVIDAYYGDTVRDDYRWLEDFNDPAVKQWSDAQNKRTREYLDHLAARELILKQLQQINSASSPGYSLRSVSGVLFAMKYQPPKNQPFLISLGSVENPASEQVILDPNTLNPGGTTAIDFYVPSPDGKRVAVSLSEGGSEDGTLHIFETATGKELGDVIPRVNFPTAGGSMAWTADGSGMYYTRYPHPGERPNEDANFYQQVYFHTIGSPVSEDKYVIGKDLPRIAEITLHTSKDGRYLLVQVANGDGGEFAHYLLSPDHTWTQITQFSDKINLAVFGPDETLYLRSIHDAPMGKILRLSLDHPELKLAKTIVKEGSVALREIIPTDHKLYVSAMAGGPGELMVLDADGTHNAEVPILPVSTVGPVINIEGDDILFGNESYLEPFAWYRYGPSSGKVTKTAYAESSPVKFDDLVVSRETATSKDGTIIPMSIIRRKDITMDGNNPALLTGYGGYDISQVPYFDPREQVWFNQGGIIAFANTRGGGEFGERWHNAGKLEKKQNVFDDFAACAQHLIDAKYTSPAKLAIEGGSNGGLLMGAELTQHPGLFRAVVAHVGIFDMLRWELEVNGAFNVTEIGSVRNPEQYKAISAYSPYHHVVDGTAYPAAFFLTGEHDGRVDPRNSRKMTARLQAASGSGHPILLWTSPSAGHGIGTSVSEGLSQKADVEAFLFDQLGIDYKSPQVHQK